MTAPQMPDAERFRRFAWDGFSFLAPADWNLSGYSFRKDFARMQMEDDYALRLEMEWVRDRRPVTEALVRKRCDAAAHAMAEAGAQVATVADLPEHWSAFLYSLPDGRHLLTAFRIEPGSRFFCFFRLHFEAASRREPPRLIRQIAAGFTLHEQGPVPWEVFDIAFSLNREFRLANTSFQAGRKLMIFEWRLRRLLIWFFSPADVILKGVAPEEWCARFLNEFKGLRGPVFAAGNAGEIGWRPAWRYPFGHFEEIGRWCFRYRAQCALLPEKNQVALYVFNYRSAADLARLVLETPAARAGKKTGLQPAGGQLT